MNEFPRTTSKINQIVAKRKSKQKVNERSNRKKNEENRNRGRQNRKRRNRKGGRPQVNHETGGQRPESFPPHRGGPSTQMGRRQSNNVPGGQRDVRNSGPGGPVSVDHFINMTRPPMRKGGKNGSTKSRIVNRTGFNAPMPIMIPESRSTKGDGCEIVGSELIKSLVVRNTSHAYPTQPGDIIYSCPCNPKFKAATRGNLFSRLYRDYKYESCCVEYVPNISVFQPGTIGMCFVYDPSSNLNLETSGIIRERIFMAQKGAVMFPCKDYGRVYLEKDEDTLKQYFLHLDDEARLEMQAIFFIIALSTFPDSSENSSNTETIGTLWEHSKLRLDVRNVEIESAELDPNVEGYFINGSTVLTVFGTPTTLNAIVKIPIALLLSALGVSTIEPGAVLQITSKSNLIINGTLTNSQVNCPEGDLQFGSQGSVWYGYVVENDSSVYMTPDLNSALDREDNSCLRWNQALTATWTLVWLVEIDLYRLDSDN